MNLQSTERLRCLDSFGCIRTSSSFSSLLCTVPIEITQIFQEVSMHNILLVLQNEKSTLTLPTKKKINWLAAVNAGAYNTVEACLLHGKTSYRWGHINNASQSDA